MHAVEEEMLCTTTMAEKVPKFNAPIYLENKSQIGKVDEILGPINEVYFTIKPGPGMLASSFKKGDKVYIAGDMTLPLERFLPRPKVVDGQGEKCSPDVAWLAALIISLFLSEKCVTVLFRVSGDAQLTFLSFPERGRGAPRGAPRGGRGAPRGRGGPRGGKPVPMFSVTLRLTLISPGGRGFGGDRGRGGGGFRSRGGPPRGRGFAPRGRGF